MTHAGRRHGCARGRGARRRHHPAGRGKARPSCLAPSCRRSARRWRSMARPPVTGDRIGLGRDLGVDQNTSGGWFGVEWRFAPRHRLGFTYTPLHAARRAHCSTATCTSATTSSRSAPTCSRSSAGDRARLPTPYSLLKRPKDEASGDGRRSLDRLSFRVDASASFGRAQPLERGRRQRQRTATALRSALRP